MNQKKKDVKVVRVDDIIREDIYLLQIDTQGFDQYVVEGASEIFKHHVVRQVIVEVDAYNMGHNNHTVHGFLDVLQSKGMMCFTTRTDQLKNAITSVNLLKVLRLSLMVLHINENFGVNVGKTFFA